MVSIVHNKRIHSKIGLCITDNQLLITDRCLSMAYVYRLSTLYVGPATALISLTRLRDLVV